MYVFFTHKKNNKAGEGLKRLQKLVTHLDQYFFTPIMFFFNRISKLDTLFCNHFYDMQNKCSKIFEAFFKDIRTFEYTFESSNVSNEINDTFSKRIIFVFVRCYSWRSLSESLHVPGEKFLIGKSVSLLNRNRRGRKLVTKKCMNTETVFYRNV